ncbi:HypC/HybG/HupF family hydrogenase formation chaperone [Paraburkholderia sp.]|uniref:HypC/HybG/HupF family hydrogenase formation chaperone n=1 Tax=Paraburkholderia sp. TaxID=1926495 RepID=UPI00286F0F27|nr:HypC/HybG/HupF family hydrogenase formation chaperone [Paraburkholderia sp.]
MCMGIPARIVCSEGLVAQAVTRHGACAIDLALTGTLPAGAWVLTFLGAAREVIDADRARDIDAALDALEAIARDEIDSAHTAADLDRYFADLTNREPQLPAHLRARADSANASATSDTPS